MLLRSSSAVIKTFCLSLVLAGLAYGVSFNSHAEEKAAAAPQENATAEKVEIPQPSGDLMGILEGDHVLGNPEAPIRVIEYASLSCTHCASFHTETFPLLEEKYIKTGKITFIFRHFPFNEPALRGAVLAECAGEEKFWTYLKVMFKSQEKWAFSENFLNDLRTLANVGGLGAEKFDACLKDKKMEERIVAGVTWAADRLKVQSTPTLFVADEMVQGFRNIDALSAIIDKKLKEAGAE